MSRKLLEGKVASVLNEREVAINIGSVNGVKEGMRFKILADKPIEIRDPETDELLGTVVREKVRVQAVEVQERLSVCRTYRSTTSGGSPFHDTMRSASRLGSIEAPKTVTETLRANQADKPAPLDEAESLVKRGDMVVELSTNESNQELMSGTGNLLR